MGFRVALSILMLLVLGDATFANYAGSIFGEFPGLVGVGLMSIGAVYLGTFGVKQRLGLALVLALTSKTQGVTLFIPIAAFLVITTLRRKSGIPTNSWWHPSRPALIVLGKIVPLAVIAGLTLAPLWVLDNNPTQFQAINPWELISVGILENSPDPPGTTSG